MRATGREAVRRFSSPQSSEVWSAEIHFRFLCLGFIVGATRFQVRPAKGKQEKRR